MTTVDDLQKFLSSRLLDPGSYLAPLPRLTCKDGLSFSMQASSFHYCSPRDNIGPWTHVELGFPSVRVDAWMDRAEEKDIPTETVYSHVPIEMVAEVVDEHGGLE